MVFFLYLEVFKSSLVSGDPVLGWTELGGVLGLQEAFETLESLLSRHIWR